MNYLDLLKLNLSFKNTFEDINNINNTHIESIENYQNLDQLYTYQKC